MKKLILLCMSGLLFSAFSFALTPQEQYIDSYITNALSNHTSEKKNKILKSAETKLQSLVSALPIKDTKRPILEMILNVVKFQLQTTTLGATITSEATVVTVTNQPVSVNTSVTSSDKINQNTSSLLNPTQNELLVIMNQIRKENGLWSLVVSSTLQNIAKAHVDEMDTHNYFNHTNLAWDDSISRVEKAGYKFTYVWETLAFNADTADVVAYGRLGSTAWHKEILLSSKATEVGIGFSAARWIWTAVYANPINLSTPWSI